MNQKGSATPAPPDLPPAKLGRYRLVRPLSTGGMARVFEGRRESLAGVSPRVAIKVILPDFAEEEGFRRLFKNEALIGAQLQHQNLVQIQDFDRQGKHFFLVMEFVDGITLRRAINLCRQHGAAIPLTVIAEFGRQVCDGLHYAHTARAEDGSHLHLVHRDIKPSNLMLNGQGVLKVLDFGISKALFSQEQDGTVRGTWGYMSPEQAEGRRTGPLSDLFGLASVLYELATLRPLFPERDRKELRQALANDEGARRAAALSGPCGALAPLLVRALQRDAAARYPSALAFQRALASLVAEPVRVREEVLFFWGRLRELQGAAPSVPGYGDGSAAGPGSGASSLASGGALAPDSSQGTARAGESSAVAGHPSAGLPVAIGRAPGDLKIEGDPPAVARGGRGRRSWFRYLVALVGVCILLFAGLKVLGLGPSLWQGSPSQSGQELAPQAGEPAQPASVEAVVSPAAEPPQPTAPSSEDEGREAGTESPSSPELAGEGGAEGAAGAASSEPQGAAIENLSVEAPPPVPRSALPPDSVGLLTVSSMPRSRVYLDDEFLRWAPLFQQAVVPGPHVVKLVTEDGRSYTFRVEVEEGQEVRKIWHFEQGMWVEQ